MDYRSKTIFITSSCVDKSVLDLGCVRHNADFSLKDPNWLHARILNISSHVVGVDYAKDEVEKLNKLGYNILYADVTKQLPIQEKFDVIVAGDLIEHLTSFDGFFENVNRLLKDDGMLIITTPNPFYRDGFFYTFFKGHVLVNPEHTCWIDPHCMKQLVSRYSLEITEMYWISERWELENLITNDKYDILNGKWEDETAQAKIKRKVVSVLFGILYLPVKIIISGDYNRFSDYLVVIRKKNKNWS